MGARAYRYLCLYEPAAGCLIEIGSERGEGSTAWLDQYARQHHLKFLTADIDPAIYKDAATITDGARHMRGVDMLKRLRSPVSIAYMDGFDWIPDHASNEPWIEDQRRSYQALGYELANNACQQEHLEEAKLIARKATTRCVVIVDDTWRTDDGTWTGKGGLAVPHLENEGFTVAMDEGCAPNSLGFALLRR